MSDLVDIDRIKNRAVKRWMCKSKNDINEDILLLCFRDKELKNFFLNNYSNAKNPDCFITSIQKLTKQNLNNKKKTNIILVIDAVFSFGYLDIFKDEKIKILFCEIYNEQQLNDYVTSEGIYYLPTIPRGFIHQIYLQSQDPFIFIYNTNYIKDFISIFLDNNDDSICKFTNYSVKLFLFRNMNTITIETILSDIDYLERESILTSRLAIFIYKICTFHSNATDKEIGLYYYNKLNIRSKPYNNKRFNISNTKGYFISEMKYQKEYNIRVNIASYLAKNSDCPTETISNATGISQVDIISFRRR